MFLRFSIVAFFLIGFIGENGAQNFEWVKGFDFYENLLSEESTIDTYGNFIVAGNCDDSIYFEGSNPMSLLLSDTTRNGFVLKLDTEGLFLWVKQLRGEVTISKVITDSQNNIYLTGRYRDTLNVDPGISDFKLTSSSQYNYDIFILKMDSNGNFIWAKQFNGSDNNGDWGRSVSVDNQGNVYATGNFKSTIDFDPGPGVFNLSAGSSFYRYVVKLNNNGNFVWANKVGSGGNSCIGEDLCMDDSANVYVTGQFIGTTDFDPGVGASTLIAIGNDGYIQKFDSSGSSIWVKQLQSINYSTSWSKSVALDNSNNIIVSGYFNDTVDFDPGPSVYYLTASNGNSSFFLKLDSDGNFIWAKCLNNTGANGCVDHDICNDNSIIFCGNFLDSLDFDPGPGVDYSVCTNSGDAYILKLNENGDYLWNYIAFSESSGAGKTMYSTNIYDDKITSVGKLYDTIIFPGYNDSTILYTNNQPSIFILRLNDDSCYNFLVSIDSVLNLTCYSNGYASSQFNGGIPPYNFYWNISPPDYNTFTTFNSTGFFTFFVTDSIGCNRQRTVLIDGPETFGYDFIANGHASSFRSSFSSSIWLDGFNDGCTLVSGTLSLVLDSLVTYNSSIPPPDNISGDTLFWNFTDLIYDSLHITPVINVTTLGQIGDTVCFDVMIDPISGDADSSNNYKTYCFPVVNGYDPNFKQVYPQGECVPNYVLKDEPLTYTIHFQNTGNADAINIRILDTLDPNLDLSTLLVIGNSHYVITEILPGNVMDFRFDNIHLPDSGSNEPASHGYVIYEVYPLAGTPDYTLINNTSHIYFDFNPAIVTNTTNNTLIDTIPSSYSAGENVSVCYNSDYTLPDGTLITNIIIPFSYQSNLLMVDGCDSIITSQVSVLPQVNVSTTLNGFTITADASGMNYQWFDCNTNAPISGETNQSFTPAVDGDYSVIITDGNCSDTSACVNITGLGIDSDYLSLIKIYPNPANDFLIIEIPKEMRGTIVEITDVTGKMIHSHQALTTNEKIDICRFPNGMYFIQIGDIVNKLIKE